MDLQNSSSKYSISHAAAASMSAPTSASAIPNSPSQYDNALSKEEEKRLNSVWYLNDKSEEEMSSAIMVLSIFQSAFKMKEEACFIYDQERDWDLDTGIDVLGDLTGKFCGEKIETKISEKFSYSKLLERLNDTKDIYKKIKDIFKSNINENITGSAVNVKKFREISNTLINLIANRHKLGEDKIRRCWKIFHENLGPVLDNPFPRKEINEADIEQIILHALKDPLNSNNQGIKEILSAGGLQVFNALMDLEIKKIVEIAKQELEEEVAKEEAEGRKKAEKKARQNAAAVDAKYKSDQKCFFEQKKIEEESSQQQTKRAAKAISTNQITSSEGEGPWKIVHTVPSSVPKGIQAFLTETYEPFPLHHRVFRWITATPEQVSAFVDKNEEHQNIKRYSKMQVEDLRNQIMWHDIGGLRILLANERFRKQYLIETQSEDSSATGYGLLTRCCLLTSAKELEQMPWRLATVGVSKKEGLFHFFVEQKVVKDPSSVFSATAAATSHAPEKVRVDEEEGGPCAFSLNNGIIRILRFRSEGVSSILEIAPK